MHEDVKSAWIDWIIGVMTRTPRHTYQILTKRANRLRDFAWPSNAWVGVTVEHPDYLDRIEVLGEVSAPLRFVSFEPLLAPMPMDLGVRLLNARIAWCIVGAETGPGKRPMENAWARDIKFACHAAPLPQQWPRFFFKRNSAGTRMLYGRTYDERPDSGGNHR